MKINKKFAVISGISLPFLLLAIVLFVPPIRDKFFYTNLWPWPLADDITQKDIDAMASLAKPGDVIVETNMHYWQWVTLSAVNTGSSWVHTSLVDDNGKMITVDKAVNELPFSKYLDWHSTRMTLVRPLYKSDAQIKRAIEYGRSKIGTAYDPAFKNPNASCTGIVGESLRNAGLEVKQRDTFGTRIYGASSFVDMPGAKVIWTSDNRKIQ